MHCAKRFLLLASLTTMAGAADAVTLTETFPDPLGGWNNRWLYQNSNLENLYIAQGVTNDPNDRGNNPVGLWMCDTQGFNTGIGGPVSQIIFNSTFAASLTSLSFGIEAFAALDVTFFDMSNNVLSTATFSGGNFGFDHADIASATSTNGISRIRFDSTARGGGEVEGNTSVDNFTAVTAVPEPASLALVGAGVAFLAARRRRSR